VEQRGLAVLVARIDVRTGVEQCLADRAGMLAGHLHQRRLAVAIRDVRILAALQQPDHDRARTVSCREEQRWLFERGFAFQQRENGVARS